MTEEKLQVYSFFEKRAVVVIAETERDARDIVYAGGGDRDSKVEFEMYCWSDAPDGLKPTPFPESARTAEEQIETYRAALKKIVGILEDEDSSLRTSMLIRLIANTALE